MRHLPRVGGWGMLYPARWLVHLRCLYLCVLTSVQQVDYTEHLQGLGAPDNQSPSWEVEQFCWDVARCW